MEEFLIDCLLNMRSDGEKLKELKYFLHSAWESEEYYMFSNEILKCLNDVIRCFSYDKPQQPEYLAILIEFLHFVVVKNKSMSFWNNLGLELGESCVKILILIEKTQPFEHLFEKLLIIITQSSEDTPNVWKPVSRPILNVFINKNFSFEFMEKAFAIYISILNKIDKFEISKFAGENLGLLKTFFTKIPNVGDFQIQENIMKIVFLHLNEEYLIRSFFDEADIKMFQNLNTNNIESLCRKYLNEINKRAERQKVYSIGCQTISLKGHQSLFLQNKQVIWVDANRDTQKLTINCSEPLNNENISIPFSNLRKIENEKTLEGDLRITITSKTNENTTENIIFKIHESSEKDAFDLIDFLREIRKSRKHLGHKLSQTCDLIHINREELEEMGKSGSQNSSKRIQINTITSSIENTSAFIPEKVSSTHFIDSLNKNIMTSPNKFGKFDNPPQNSFETNKNTPLKLFNSPLKIVNNSTPGFKNMEMFDEKSNKLSRSLSEMKKENQNSFLHPSLEFQKKYEDKIFESQSSYQEYFRSEHENPKKKPLWSKLKTKSKRCSNVKKKESKETVMEKPKPSLLDPNGYTFKRWIQPTTSKRSNFWLDKLKNLEREKENSRDGFEFCENSRTEKKNKTKKKSFWMKKGKSKKKKLVIFERKSEVETEETKKPEKIVYSLNEISLPRFEVEKEKVVGNVFEEVKAEPEKEYVCDKEKERVPGEISDEDIFGDLEPHDQKNKEVESVPDEQNRNYDEDIFEDEGEIGEDVNRNADGIPDEKKLRKTAEEYSFEVVSSTKFLKKKKLKLFPIPHKLKIFQVKMKKSEQKAQKESEEIIETVRKATENLFSKIEKKELMKVTSYLKVLEEVGPEISDPSQILNTGLWIQRFGVCYEARRSWTKSQEILKVRDVLEQLMESTINYSRNFGKMYENLKKMMKKGIEERIKDEVRERSQKLQEMKISDFP